MSEVLYRVVKSCLKGILHTIAPLCQWKFWCHFLIHERLLEFHRKWIPLGWSGLQQPCANKNKIKQMTSMKCMLPLLQCYSWHLKTLGYDIKQKSKVDTKVEPKRSTHKLSSSFFLGVLNDGSSEKQHMHFVPDPVHATCKTAVLHLTCRYMSNMEARYCLLQLSFFRVDFIQWVRFFLRVKIQNGYVVLRCVALRYVMWITKWQLVTNPHSGWNINFGATDV